MMNQVSDDLLSLLRFYIKGQDDEFLRGFVSCLFYQYPYSELAVFYFFNREGNSFKSSLSVFLDNQFINSGKLQPVLSSSIPAVGEGNQ